MSSNEQIIATFQTRVRDLLHQFQELKKENQGLYEMVEKNEQDIKDLQAKLTQADHDYQSLKMAKMLEITDGDLEGAKTRVAKMIRDVNKCIALLSDEAPNQ
jgi:TolA-binding protein